MDAQFFAKRHLVAVLFLAGLQLAGFRGYSQYALCKSYTISPSGDTLNCMDKQDRKQGPWVNHFDEVRGEPGYEEEGFYKNSRKTGRWRLYDLQGDLIGLEYYKWGLKDSVCQYFGMNGSLLREESWKALNPDKQYDTVQVADVDHFDTYKTVVVKNEGVALRDGVWKFYDPATRTVIRTETYTLGKLEKSGSGTTVAAAPQKATKPKEVLEFEKKTGKKKVKVQDGSTY